MKSTNLLIITILMCHCAIILITLYAPTMFSLDIASTFYPVSIISAFSIMSKPFKSIHHIDCFQFNTFH